MQFLLIGDSSALSNWSYTDNPSIAILIVLFSLLIVIYLMNLLIGLLNNAIEEDNNRVSYLIQKAEVNNINISHSISVNILIYPIFIFFKILAEIELFYLLPHQRRWQAWFPEVMYVI
jgi:hypothetical protein